MVLRIFIVFFNFLVAGLNWETYLKSSESRDFWATMAWLGAGLAWCLNILDMVGV